MIPFRLGLTAALLFAGLLAVCQALGDHLAETEPGRALRLFPGHAGALEARAEAAIGDTADLAQIERLAARQLRRAPLDASPLALTGLARAQSGDDDTASALMRAAIARDPRERLGYMYLVRGRLDEGDFAAALELIDRLYTLDGANRGAYQDILFAMAQTPDGQAALLAALDGDPAWASGLARRAAALDDRGFVYALVQRTGEGQPRYVGQLVREERYDQAFLAWLSFLEQAGGRFEGWPHDPRFEDLEGSGPFNWQLRRGKAEFLKEGGLYASYLGKGRVRMASQVMALSAPGTYRISAAMRGEIAENGGTFRWHLDCIDPREGLGELRISELGPSETTFEMTVALPRRCDFQRLSLSGYPGEFPRPARARISQVGVRRDTGADP